MTNPDPESSQADLPAISLIVLNYNGIEHLQDCLKSLLVLDYPGNKCEILLVDNGSSDDSVAYVREHFSTVRIIQNTSNLGFAAGNNVGAAGATGKYVIFLNNDMSVDRQMAIELVKAIQANPDAVCAGARILDWNGTHIDYDGGAGHFAGYAYQVGYGKSLEYASTPDVCPILFACGGACLIERQVFLDVGGFDEAFFMVYEDFDLGWRLWLLGYKVLYAPKAVVNHRHHGSMNRVSDHRKTVLYKRNSLLAALKNYNDDNMPRVLAVILFANNESVLSQAVAQGQINLDDFAFENAAKLKQSTLKLDATNVATIVAMHDVVKMLPKAMEKRRFVQSKRVRTDEQMAALFRLPFRYWPDVNAITQYELIDAFDLQQIYEGLPRRVLIISSDILPYPGFPTVGSGLRAWGLGQGLISCGHEVFFSMPKAAITGRERLAPPEVARIAWEHHTMMSIVHDVEPDVIVVCNWAILPLLSTELLSIPIILDQHGPHMLERKYQNFGNYDENARSKLDALGRSDFFTCAGHKQKQYFSKWLTDAGWSENERAERFAAIPVSLSPSLPKRQPAAEITFVYGGVFLPWQDPSVSLSTLVEVLDNRNVGRLLFYGGRHPVYSVDPGIFESLMVQLQGSSHVQICGMVSHDELIASYTKAHVAIDLMKRNPERELAFTTRTVEYLWCGLPVIYNNYSELSEYIHEYNAGWIVDPEDQRAIANIIEEIIQNPAEVLVRGQNAQRLVLERLNWALTIAPMDDFIRHPRMRPLAHQIHSAPLPTVVRNSHYLAREAWRHYQRGGPTGLWKEATAFLRRQIR